MQDTNITWADWTWNPIRGCSRISPGCMNCYAETLAARFARSDMGPAEWTARSEAGDLPPFHGFAEFRIVGGKREPHWTGKVELIAEKLMEPLSWRRKALKFREQHGRKPRAFISMSDLFHESLPDEDIDRVFAVAALTPEINYMFLTKRAARMAEYFSDEWLSGRILCQSTAIIDECVDPLYRKSDDLRAVCQMWEADEPLPNVALGVSVESQKYADERIPHLLRTPAAMRFVSYEPALEAVDFTSIEWPNKNGHRVDALRAGYWNEDGYVAFGPSAKLGEARGGFTNHSDMNALDMIIVGGESGPGARPFDIAWARSTVEQCRAAGVAPFVKQMGSNPVILHTTGEDSTGPYVRLESVNFRDRKGEDMSEWPADLRVREWPEGWN